MAGGTLDLGGDAITGAASVHTDALAGPQGPGVTLGNRSVEVQGALEVAGDIRMANGDPIMQTEQYNLFLPNHTIDPQLGFTGGFCYLSAFDVFYDGDTNFPQTVCRARVINGAWSLQAIGPSTSEVGYQCQFTCVETSSR